MANDIAVLHRFDIKPVALYHHFLIFAEENELDYPNFTNESVAARITATNGMVAVQTVSSGVITVHVHIDILSARPITDLDLWDHISETSLRVASGHLVVAGSLYDPPNRLNISISPGTYRIRAQHADIGSVLAAYYAGNLDVVEEIVLLIWSEEYSEPIVLKQYIG